MTVLVALLRWWAVLGAGTGAALVLVMLVQAGRARLHRTTRRGAA